MTIDLVTVQGLWPVLSRVPTLVGWLGQWYFTQERLEASILERRKIASGAAESLFLSGSIPDGAANQIATAIWNNQDSLEGNIEFNARGRSFAKRIGVLSGIQVSIINAHTRLRQPAHSNA